MSGACTIEVTFDGSASLEDIERLKKHIFTLKGVCAYKYTDHPKVVLEVPKQESAPKDTASTTNMFTVKQMAERHPAFTIGSLRNLIFCAKNNNFEQCVKRVGSKVLLLEDEFLKWVAGNPTKKIIYATHDLKKYGR